MYQIAVPLDDPPLFHYPTRGFEDTTSDRCICNRDSQNTGHWIALFRKGTEIGDPNNDHHQEYRSLSGFCVKADVEQSMVDQYSMNALSWIFGDRESSAQGTLEYWNCKTSWMRRVPRSIGLTHKLKDEQNHMKQALLRLRSVAAQSTLLKLQSELKEVHIARLEKDLARAKELCFRTLESQVRAMEKD